MPAMRSAAVFAHEVCPSTRDSTTGLAGAARSSERQSVVFGARGSTGVYRVVQDPIGFAALRSIAGRK